jgi:sorbitol-specific phosphotransferase system component IIC
MENFHHLQDIFPCFLPILVILILWEAVWKIIALWKAARNNQLAWFICIAVINTVGILPIIYILMQMKKKSDE